MGEELLFLMKVEMPGWFGGTAPFNFSAIW